MKHKKAKIFFSIAVCAGVVAYAALSYWDSEVSRLKKLDAFQAVDLANQWKWSRDDVKSYVTQREVVFELDEERVVEIALPEDKMIIAVAPYINQTHG